MSKEIYISTTPHETRLAIVEDEQLAEVYYERENEYTLAGSIYNGRVTRVLPGMQSSFVDIGLERDAFLYVTDFMEEQGDAADFDAEGGRKSQAPREASTDAPRERVREEGGRRGRNGRDRGERGNREQARPAVAESDETSLFEEPIAPKPVEVSALTEVSGDEAIEEQGSRRWRGRRGRRRGRGGRDGASPLAGEVEGNTEPIEIASEPEHESAEEPERLSLEGSAAVPDDGPTTGAIEIDVDAEPRAPEDGSGEPRRFGRDRNRGSRNRGGREDRGRGREDRPRREEFQPSYKAESDIAAIEPSEAEPAIEAIVLPGESIRKYRDPAEVAAEDAARRPAHAAEVLTPTVPAIEIAGWDGGSVLPGETLSRHRNREPHTAPRREESREGGRRGGRSDRFESRPVPVAEKQKEFEAEHGSASLEPVELQAYALAPVSVTGVVGAEQNIAPTPIPDAESIAAADAPDETGGLTQHPAHADESASVGPVVALEASADESTEYEPAEGDAASLGDAGRRDYRRMEQRTEEFVPAGESPVDDPELLADSPDETSYDLRPEVAKEGHPESESPLDLSLEPVSNEAAHSFTTVEDSGEMLSATASALVDDAGHLPPTQDVDEPILAETSIQAAVLAEDHMFAHDHNVHTVIDSDADADAEPMHDGTLVAAPGDAVAQVHAYGDGDLEEEEVDGEEYEYNLAVDTTDEDEFEDYEEETLDGSDAIDSVMEEISLAEAGEDEDDTEYPAESDTGGFTVDDFGGEPTEIAESAPALQNANERRGRREGGRDGRRGGSRDRDRKPGGGFRGGASAAASGGGDRGRGRGRQSVQTMDLPAINELLKPGQEILVQIAKEPIAKKGARITSHIALPGRFLVFMPTVNHTGVSRKISSDEERRRLKTILLSEKGDAQGGFIVRTAADGASEEELRNDLRFLIQLWQDIKARSESSKSPALIYHDLSLIERILRDQVTDNFSAIWVDTEAEYERVLRFLQRFQPSLVRRVKLYTKETPLFEHFGVTAEIDKALKSKVWLKSGGSIVIDQTEALVAIDINTGKYVGKTARLEDTILKTNLDAIPEIVRQIRLRDLGGIIVIDFIDMDERKNRAKVMQVLEEELKSDRAPSKVLPFNDFGLVIMTRKRVKQSLERTLCIPDAITDGTGMIKSPITVANEIFIEMRKMQRHFEKSDVMLRVHPEVVKTLKANGGKRLQELEEMTRKTILVKSDPAINPEQFDIH